MGSSPWAIVDFPGPDGRPSRQVFRNPVAVLATQEIGKVVSILDRAEVLAKSGHHLVGYVAYDAGPAFDAAFAVRRGYDGPLVWFAAFSAPSGEEILAAPAPVGSWTADIDPVAHRAAVGAIIDGIEAGDFYQVNFTGRFRSTIDRPLAVYERVRKAQRAKYSAFIETGEQSIISVSPELFVNRSGNVLESRPMKGTAPRGRWSGEDNELARQLATSEKERAENVMIVDLIRSDMGRIAVPGTVEVPSMFTVEKYPTVLQMTSHVKSQVVATVSLGDVFSALFPCGSITGAPKIAASKAIASLESEPRGVYCGAIGIVRPGGDFIFNVGIRTITVSSHGGAVYGAGGGITADSNPGREFEELQTKAAVLTSDPGAVSLIETMRLEDGRIHRLGRHLKRLSASADYFGFADVDQTIAALEVSLATEASARPTGVFRVRVLLPPDGIHAVSIEPFQPAPLPRRIALSRLPVDSQDRLLYHKTTDRSRYAERLAEVPDADDVVMINERGELTETSIGNLVLELDGRLLTPKLDCGLLPGILREELIAEHQIREAVLYPDDLPRSSQVWMINSLRGWVPATILRADDPARWTDNPATG